MEVACQGVGLDLVQPESLPVRDDLVLEERIRTIPRAGNEASAHENGRGGRRGKLGS